MFDFNTDLFFKEKHKGTYNRKSGNFEFVQICKYNENTRVAETIFSFENNQIEVHVQKGYTFLEVEKNLIKAGFRVKYAFDIIKQNTNTENPWKVLIFAQTVNSNGT
jgi:hypothetical protein